MPVGAQTAPKRVNLINQGSVNTVLSSVIAPGGFAITSNTCADNIVKAYSSCAIWVGFAPVATGSFTNRVAIASTAGPFYVTVTGTSLEIDEDGLPDEWEAGTVTLKGESINL